MYDQKGQALNLMLTMQLEVNYWRIMVMSFESNGYFLEATEVACVVHVTMVLDIQKIFENFRQFDITMQLNKMFQLQDRL